MNARRLARFIGLGLLCLASTDATGQEVEVSRVEQPKRSLRIDPTAHVQLDVRAFPGWSVPTVVDRPLRNDVVELRRARLGLDGRWNRFVFHVRVETANSDWFRTNYIEWRPGRGVRLRAGHFKLPMSPEFLTSSATTDLVERSMLARELAPGRDLGVMLRARPRSWLRCQAGVFAGDGSFNDERSGMTGAARLVITPLSGLDLNVAYARGRVETTDERKGFRGMSPSGFPFFRRLPVEGRRRRVDLALSYARGSLGLEAEYLEGREARRGQSEECEWEDGTLVCQDLPDLVGRGWAVTATWLITGEKKTGTIRPRREFPDGLGAVELAARVEGMRFDDVENVGPEGVGRRIGNLRPSADLALTAGACWWPRRWMRLMTNVVIERFEDPYRAPEAGRRGNYASMLTRLQVMLP